MEVPLSHAVQVVLSYLYAYTPTFTRMFSSAGVHAPTKASIHDKCLSRLFDVRKLCGKFCLFSTERFIRVKYAHR